MEWGGGGGGGGGVSPARWCSEESGDSEELQFEGADQGMGIEDDHLHEDDAESCTGKDEEEEEEEEMMQGNNGRDDQRIRSKVVVDNGWRRWFPTHDESCCCCSSKCDHEEINGSEQCVRSVCVDQEEHSVHQIQDNRLFWETCLAVGY